MGLTYLYLYYVAEMYNRVCIVVDHSGVFFVNKKHNIACFSCLPVYGKIVRQP